MKQAKQQDVAESLVAKGARLLWEILEKDGPAGKTGLSLLVADQLGMKVNPRLFSKILYYARRELSESKGRAVVYDSYTDQYGFAESIGQGQAYILSFNSKYLATRAETMEIQARAVMKEHGESEGLRDFVAIARTAAKGFRAVAQDSEDEVKAWRAARRTGANAELELENHGIEA